MATPGSSKPSTGYKQDSKISVKVKVLVEPKMSNLKDSVVGTVIDSITLSTKTIFLPVEFQDKMKTAKFYHLTNISMPGESMKVHPYSLIMHCGKFNFPAKVEEDFYHPPAVNVTEAICSPRKRRLSITGELTDVSPVMITQTSRRKILKLSTNDNTIEVKLWGDHADLPTPPIGNTVTVSCLRMSEFRGKVDANSTEITKVEEVADRVPFEGEIEAVTFDMDNACVLMKGQEGVWSVDHTDLTNVFPFEEFEDETKVKGLRQGTKILKLPYFERKAELQTKLEFLKVAVEALHDAVSQSKRKYSEALSNLELISNQVHEQRKGKLMLHLPREPGVGEESASPGPGGGVNLRTSFDDPDTPGIGQATFNISAEECDVIKEEDEDGEEEDVSESSSDVSDSSFKDTSSPAQPTEQSQLGGSVQSQKDTDSVQQTEPTGNSVTQVSKTSEKPECQSTCQRPKVLGNGKDANLCSKYDDLGEESNNHTANPEMATNCSQKSKINETENRPSVGGSNLQGSLNASSQKSLGNISQHSPTGISSLSTPRTESSQAPSCVQHAPASSVIEHGHSPHPSTRSSLPQTPTVDSRPVQTSPDDNLQAPKTTANSEQGTRTSDSPEFTTVSSSHETLPRPPVIGSSSEIGDGRQK